MKKLLTLLFAIFCLTLLASPAMAIDGVESLAIVGTGIPGVTEWNPADAAGDMKETEDGIFVKKISITAGTTITFKFAANDNWEINFGGATVVAGEAVTLTANGNNISLTVDKDTTLTFTVDLTGENATMLVKGDGLGETPELPEPPATPAGDLEKMSMMGEGLPSLTWDPGSPTNEMKKEGNVFVKELGISAGTTIKFKFAGNGAWDSGYNFGSGVIEVGKAVEMANANDSTDMTYTATENCTLKFTVDASAIADGGAATVTLEILPPAAPPTIEDDTITISVDPFNDWTQVLVYVWSDETGEYASWPGVAMSDADGDGWYEVQVPAGYPKMIVSNGAGYQTANLEVDGTVDIWVTISTDEAGMITVITDYINPGDALDDVTPVPEPAALDFLSMVGEGCDGLIWDPTDESMKMTRNGDIFTKELYVPTQTTINFKFAGNGSWDSGYNFGSATIEPGKFVEMENGDDSLDMSYTTTGSCTLRFTVNIAPIADGGNVLVMVEEFVETYTVHVDPFDDWETTYLYCWYDAYTALTPWPGDPVTDADGDGWYELEIPMGYINLLVTNGDNLYSMDLEVIGTQDVWITMMDMDVNIIDCTLSYIDPGPAYTATTPEIAPKLPYTLSIVGDGFPDLPVWDLTDPAGIMDEISTGVYVKELLVSGYTQLSFKFVGNQDWASGFNFGTASVVLGESVQLTNDSESMNLYLTPEKGCRLRFTVDLSLFDGTKGALLCVEEIPSEMKTIHVKSPAHWGTPYCLAWKTMYSEDSIFYNAPIPGDMMIDSGDWYTIEIPVWCDCIIINGNSGIDKTFDLSIEAGREVWLICKDDSSAEIYYEEPAPEPPTEPTAPTDVPEGPTEPTGEPAESTYPKMTRPHDYDEAEKLSEKKKDSGSPLMLILIAVGAVVLLGGGVTLIFVLKKKKKA